MSPTPEFVAAVLASLDYWRERTVDLDDQGIIRLDPDRQNLFRAMQYGLALPEAWETAAAIAVQAIPLINRRMYRTEWLPTLRELADQAPDCHEPWQIRLMVQYGRMLRLERQLDRALEIHEEAEAIAQDLGDRHLIALVSYNLGRDYLDKRQYSEAERYSRDAIEMLGRTADQAIVSLAYYTLGQCAREQGDLNASVEFLAKALEIDRSSGDATRVGRSLEELANSLRAAGRLEEAISYYDEAGKVLAPTANELEKINLAINLGGAYFEKEEWLLAEKTFRQANSSYLQQSGNLHYQALIVVCLGNALLKQERFTESTAIFRRAISLWRQVDDNLNLANALGSLGEALAGQGKAEAAEAEACFDEALRLLESYPEAPRAKRLRALFRAEREKLTRGNG